MTRKGRILLLIVFITCLLLREEILGFFLHTTKSIDTSENICTIKNQVLEQKYQELISSYGYEENISYTLEKSKVLFKNVYDLMDTITIYKGKQEGIQEKNLVINEQGLVGIVEKVNEHSSEVRLLTNKDLNLSVKIDSSYGMLVYEKNEFLVKGIDNKQNISVDDGVKTSDFSLYPENIVVGKVKKIEMDPYGIEQKIYVEPAVSFENIKYVSIITDLRGVE